MSFGEFITSRDKYPSTFPLQKKAIVFIIHLIFFATRTSLKIGEYIPLTNRVRGPYRKLRTEFFPLRFMAQARSARAINRRGKNEDP